MIGDNSNNKTSRSHIAFSVAVGITTGAHGPRAGQAGDSRVQKNSNSKPLKITN